MATTRTRTQNLAIRLLDEERAELDALARADRTSISDVIRRLVRAAFVARFGETKAKAKRAQ